MSTRHVFVMILMSFFALSVLPACGGDEPEEELDAGVDAGEDDAGEDADDEPDVANEPDAEEDAGDEPDAEDDAGVEPDAEEDAGDEPDATESCEGDLVYDGTLDACVCEAGLTRCGDTCVDTEGVCNVVIENFAFSPESLTIVEGTTVVWTNLDGASHTVTSGTPANEPGALFDSANLSQEDTFDVTFNDVGLFPYYCRPHAGSMTAEVVVLAAD